ncbi:hotdog domain-containing protein [Sulfobacillus harzensis]|uniref:Acyl-CoA thioesterase n=1 Tax=Sulfobacillus harzensis TaxID=2729629 RepID=A0A7Y0L630_9FIRM|nr:acyl-CoA thioesterase [Sulfobacillus harzensis]
MSAGPRGDITHRVLPSDVNHLGTLFGGRLLEWMDGAAEIAAARYARRVVVTVAMEQVVFTQPVQVGDLVRIEAAIDRIGRTSIRVQVTAWRELTDGTAVIACAARLTFVALDASGRPVPVRGACPDADAPQAAETSPSSPA